MKVIDVTINYHNRTAKVRFIGMYVNVTITQDGDVMRHKLVTPERARQLIGGNAFDTIVSDKDKWNGQTINVLPVQVKR